MQDNCIGYGELVLSANIEQDVPNVIAATNAVHTKVSFPSH